MCHLLPAFPLQNIFLYIMQQNLYQATSVFSNSKLSTYGLPLQHALKILPVHVKT